MQNDRQASPFRRVTYRPDGLQGIDGKRRHRPAGGSCLEHERWSPGQHHDLPQVPAVMKPATSLIRKAIKAPTSHSAKTGRSLVDGVKLTTPLFVHCGNRRVKRLHNPIMLPKGGTEYAVTTTGVDM